MKKVKLSYGVYGSHKHPVIWIKVDGSIGDRYIFLSEEDFAALLQQVVTEYLENGFIVEFVNN